MPCYLYNTDTPNHHPVLWCDVDTTFPHPGVLIGSAADDSTLLIVDQKSLYYTLYNILYIIYYIIYVSNTMVRHYICDTVIDISNTTLTLQSHSHTLLSVKYTSSYPSLIPSSRIHLALRARLYSHQVIILSSAVTETTVPGLVLDLSGLST